MKSKADQDWKERLKMEEDKKHNQTRRTAKQNKTKSFGRKKENHVKYQTNIVKIEMCCPHIEIVIPTTPYKTIPAKPCFVQQNRH